jgi:hypothetical protein
MFVLHDATAVPGHFAPGPDERLPPNVSLLMILVFAVLSWGIVVGSRPFCSAVSAPAATAVAESPFAHASAPDRPRYPGEGSSGAEPVLISGWVREMPAQKR